MNITDTISWWAPFEGLEMGQQFTSRGRPVRFGDTLRVEGRIAELAPVSDGAGLVTFAWNVVNQDGQTVTRARVEVLWKRDEVATVSQAEDATGNGEFVPIPL